MGEFVYKQFRNYGIGASFWLWNYNKSPNELKGNQNLPKKLDSVSSHVIQIIKAIPCYKKHYLRAREKHISIIFSILYALNGWFLRLSFHYGVLKGQQILQKYKKEHFNHFNA